MPQFKIYKIAKELNLASTTIMEFLNNMGHDTPKGHMSPISDELYLEVLKKFDRPRWLALQEQEKQEKVEVHKKKTERVREEELEKILAATSEISLTEEAQSEAEVEEPKKAAEGEIPAEEELKPEVAEGETEEVTEEEVVPEEKIEEPAEEPEAAVAEAKAPEEKETISEAEPAGEVEVAETTHAAETEEVEAAEKKKEEKPKKKAKKSAHEPGTFEAMLAEAKQEKTVARARELARVRDAEEMGLTPEEALTAPAKKRRLKRKKEETAEEQTIKRAIERAKRAAKERRREKKVPVKPVVQAAPPKRGKKRRRGKKHRVDQKVVDASIKQTLASMEEKKPRRRRRKVQHAGEALVEENVLKVMEFISTNELALLLDVPVAELIRKCLDMGLVVTINQRLDKDTIELLAGEYGYDIEFQSEFDGTEVVSEEEEEKEEKDHPEDLVPRPPVVTVMGHVDHGKTSLLDYLRHSNIIAGESGGITQHIGAYSFAFQNQFITFLDTPGHEAFTAMRARGAQVTDIVVLVIAADDHVMPQTVEAINHAKAAGVPIIIAINKIDKPTADPDRIRRELSEKDILVEEWGGKYQCALISAKKGDGVENLLEEIVLAAEVLDLKANPKRKARGIIIESRLDRGRGPLATVLIQNGTARIGDNFVAGAYSGRIRAMFDESGNKLKKVGPGFPVQILGFDGAPQAGESFICLETDKEAKSISLKRQALQREQAFRQIRALSLEGLSERIRKGESRELSLIIKGDVNGSVEAVCDALMKLNSDEVGVNIVHRGVGSITETDVNLAAASAASIIGFMVHPNLKSRELAARENVEIRVYRIIYDVINDVKAALEGMLAPQISENNIGTLEVRQTFKVPKIGTIAGCYVQSGKIERGSLVRLVRDGQQIYEGELSSLRRFKDDVREVTEGYECGVSISNFQDIKVGDVIEVYEIVETKRTLA